METTHRGDKIICVAVLNFYKPAGGNGIGYVGLAKGPHAVGHGLGNLQFLQVVEKTAI